MSEQTLLAELLFDENSLIEAGQDPRRMKLFEFPSFCCKARGSDYHAGAVTLCGLFFLFLPVALLSLQKKICCETNVTLGLKASGYNVPMAAEITGNADFTQLTSPKGMRWKNIGDSFQRCAAGSFHKSNVTVYVSPLSHHTGDVPGGRFIFGPDEFDSQGLSIWRQAVDAVTHHPHSDEAQVTLGCATDLGACGGSW